MPEEYGAEFEDGQAAEEREVMHPADMHVHLQKRLADMPGTVSVQRGGNGMKWFIFGIVGAIILAVLKGW